MGLTEEQLAELSENYGINRDVVDAYYELIVDRLNINNINEYTTEELYECVERCCNEEQYTLYDELKVSHELNVMTEEEIENVLNIVRLNRAKIITRSFDVVFGPYLLQDIMNFLSYKLGEDKSK